MGTLMGQRNKSHAPVNTTKDGQQEGDDSVIIIVGKINSNIFCYLGCG